MSNGIDSLQSSFQIGTPTSPLEPTVSRVGTAAPVLGGDSISPKTLNESLIPNPHDLSTQAWDRDISATLAQSPEAQPLTRPNVHIKSVDYEGQSWRKYGSLLVDPSIEPSYRQARSYLLTSATGTRVVGHIENPERGRNTMLSPGADSAIAISEDRKAADHILWNPNKALTDLEGHTVSPALALGHEMGHSIGSDVDYFKSRAETHQFDPQFGNKDERTNITVVEHRLADELGEGKRTTHLAQEYEVANPTSRSPKNGKVPYINPKERAGISPALTSTAQETTDPRNAKALETEFARHYGRPPTEAERQSIFSFVDAQRSAYHKGVADFRRAQGQRPPASIGGGETKHGKARSQVGETPKAEVPPAEHEAMRKFIAMPHII